MTYDIYGYCPDDYVLNLIDIDLRYSVTMVTWKLRYSAESKYSVITYVDGINLSSGKLPTYPFPKLTLTLTSHLGQNVSLGKG